MSPSQDVVFMKRALALAEKGRGFVHPNPMVGSVLVKNGKVLSEGYHAVCGGPHAEVAALQKIKTAPAGSTLYVTLEPCNHFGKTPPCTELILNKNVKKIVIAAKDPNPLVAGKGIARLKSEGVKVVSGVLSGEAVSLNRDYHHWMKTGLPYVVVKMAQSLDGKIATKTGDSKWITSEESRRFGHGLRAEADAILVGANTVIQDNPRLTARTGKKVIQPLKVVLDSHLRVLPSSKIFQGGRDSALIAVTKAASLKKIKAFEKKARIIIVKEDKGRVDLKTLLKALGDNGVVRVLIEGGGELIGDAFEKKLVQEVFAFVAPVIIGGREAVTSVEGRGANSLRQAFRFSTFDVQCLGSDVLLHGVL